MSSDTLVHVRLTPDVLEATLAHWTANGPLPGVLALLPEKEKDQLGLLQATCRRLNIPLRGVIFPNLVVGNDFVSEGVCLIRLDANVHSTLVTGLGQGTTADADRISAAVFSQLEPEANERPTLLMFFDAMVPNIASLLDRIYLDLADRVRYTGVNGGSETFQPMPCLFDETECHGQAILCLLLPGQPGAAMAHGYPVPRRLVTATATEGNRITSINWQPAFDMYRELIASEYGITDLTPDNFYQYACHFPFGILKADDDVVVRIPVALTEDGALFCVGEVPPNATLVLLRAPTPGTLQCSQELQSQLTRLSPPDDSPLLVFYCAGRRMHLGDSAPRELSELSLRLGGAPLLGALSLGEIGSAGSWDYPCFHNATIVLLPWVRS